MTGKNSKFKVGDRVYKPIGYEFPSTIVSVFETSSGAVRVVAEMDHYKMLHIFNENQLELSETAQSKKVVLCGPNIGNYGVIKGDVIE